MQQGRGSGMIIGQKGVKYGLIVPGRGSSGSGKPGAQAPPGVRKPSAGGTGQKLAAFGGDSDSEEEDVGTQVARQAARKRSDTKVGGISLVRAVLVGTGHCSYQKLCGTDAETLLVVCRSGALFAVVWVRCMAQALLPTCTPGVV